MRRDHVHFVLERAHKRHIAERFGITHFVDDSPEVLWHLRDTVPHRVLFNPRASGLVEFGHLITDTVPVTDWCGAFSVLCAT